MQVSIRQTFSIFRKEYPNNKIGLSRFASLRPMCVRKLSMHHREVCMCPYCLNIKYKLLALNYVSSQNTIDRKVDDDRQLLDILLCAREDGKTFHRY